MAKPIKQPNIAYQPTAQANMAAVDLAFDYLFRRVLNPTLPTAFGKPNDTEIKAKEK